MKKNPVLKLVRIPKGARYIRNADGTCTIVGKQPVEVTASIEFKDIYRNGKTTCKVDRFPMTLKDGAVFREVFPKESQSLDGSFNDDEVA